jgi:hypothetical protein
MRAVAKWLRFRQPARTPPIALALFYLYANRLPSADFRHFIHDTHLQNSHARLFRFSTRRLSRFSIVARARSEHEVEPFVAYRATIAPVMQSFWQRASAIFGELSFVLSPTARFAQDPCFCRPHGLERIIFGRKQWRAHLDLPGFCDRRLLPISGPVGRIKVSAGWSNPRFSNF